MESPLLLAQPATKALMGLPKKPVNLPLLVTEPTSSGNAYICREGKREVFCLPGAWEYQHSFQWREDETSAWEDPTSMLWPHCSSQHFWMSAPRQRQQNEAGHSSSPSHQPLTNSDPLRPRTWSYPCKWLWFGSFYSHPATVWKAQGVKHGRIMIRIISSLKEPGFLFFKLCMRSEKGSCPLLL